MTPWVKIPNNNLFISTIDTVSKKITTSNHNIQLIIIILSNSEIQIKKSMRNAH